MTRERQEIARLELVTLLAILAILLSLFFGTGGARPTIVKDHYFAEIVIPAVTPPELAKLRRNRGLPPRPPPTTLID